MASASRKLERHPGVRVTRAGGVRRDVWAVVAVGAAVVAGLFLLRAGAPPRPPAPPAPAAVAEAPPPARPPSAVAPATVPATGMTIPTTRAGKLRALRQAGIRPRRGADGRRTLDAAPVIEALNEAGVHDGIAAFPPPGTDPPKAGVIVPEAWVLPEGYVRHHQSTDDGQALPPILMFHPDYEFTDEHGNPVAVPEDRVVPPELVPPGFPVQMLDVPGRDR